MFATLAIVTSLALAPQDPDFRPSLSGKAESDSLLEKVRDMRMKLLLGGDRVREAEQQAVQFYNDKIGMVDSRLDSIEVELAEKRTAYELALDRALNARDEASRRAAMGDASAMSNGIAELRQEGDQFNKRRVFLNEQIDEVSKRERDREKIAARLETSPTAMDGFLPFGPGSLLGAEPEAEPKATGIDPQLAEDLMRRDPLRARRVLFEADPAGYWKRFPLRPPTDALRNSLTFPPMDLPGRR